MNKLTLMAALSIVAVVMASGAQAQLLQQESTVAAGVVPVPGTLLPGTPAPPMIATTIVRTYQPVCELRREQFQDEFGWRVRDIRVCR
jgi:hypothetical protein